MGSFASKTILEEFLYVRSNMESKNVWQQIFGRKNLGSKFFWMNICEAKWGTNTF